MTVKINIADPQTGIQAEVVDGIEKTALVVATRELKEYTDKVNFFFNSDYGVDLNQDAAAGGTPEEIHNGIDDVLWTGSNIAGATTTFDSAVESHVGTKSVLTNKPVAGNTYQFAKGGDIDLTGYVSLTIWSYVDSNWSALDSTSVYLYDTDTASILGNVVYLEDYFNYFEFGVWHKISIPLGDMGISGATTGDAIRIQQAVTSGIKPIYYIDEIQFEETGNPITYVIEPDNGTWLHVKNFNITIADVYAGTLADATMPKIPYDSLFALPALSTGVVYQKEISGKIIDNATIKQFSDLTSYPNTTVTGYGSDGTNSWVSLLVVFNIPIILKAEYSDRLLLTISEDLSGLLMFRISAGCMIEERE